MTSTSPPVVEAVEKARRILGLGIQEAVAYATDRGIEMATIKAAALDVGAFLLKFAATAPKAPPSRPRLKVVRAPETQLRLPLEHSR